jgi:hypothetical protein
MNSLRLSYSAVSVENRPKFETAQYKKYEKKIHYLGQPANGRTDCYFAMEHMALLWIFKKIGLKLTENLHVHKHLSLLSDSKQEARILKDGVLCIDKLVLNWDIPFYLEADRIWFLAEATVGAHSVNIRAARYEILITDAEWDPEDIYILEKKPILFSAPPPLLQSVQTVEEFGGITTYIFNIKWNIAGTTQKKIENYTEIRYENYKIRVMELGQLRALITLSSSN